MKVNMLGFYVGESILMYFYGIIPLIFWLKIKVFYQKLVNCPITGCNWNVTYVPVKWRCCLSLYQNSESYDLSVPRHIVSKFEGISLHWPLGLGQKKDFSLCWIDWAIFLLKYYKMYSGCITQSHLWTRYFNTLHII